MDPRFEQLVETATAIPSRRAVLRGLAGIVGAAGLGLALVDESDANSRRRRRRQRQRRRERRNRQCSSNKPCEASLNPCQVTSCKKHKCQTANVADGTVCGDGLTCQNGACLCPNGVCTVYVTPADTGGPWVALVAPYTVDNSVLTFQNGPATPPFGSGSVNLTVTDDSFVLANYQYSGVLLRDITTLAYATYQPSSNTDDPTNAGKLLMSIDFFGQNLPYEGIMFTPSDNGTVQQDAWQTWDAINSGAALWSYAQGCGCDWPNSTIPGSTLRTWADITSTYKLARITTADPLFGVVVENTDSGMTFADDVNTLTFGTTSGTTRYVFGLTAS
ncbi:MAG: hypothetical protein QM692_09960 [Thermomicrobiales bacterium]